MSECHNVLTFFFGTLFGIKYDRKKIEFVLTIVL